MKTAIIYGSTGTGKRVYNEIKEKYRVLYYADEDPARAGKQNGEIKIYFRDEILNSPADFIVMGQLTGLEDAIKWLMDTGISEERIISSYVDLPLRARRDCLKKIAAIFKDKGTQGTVAELGVYRGDFAKIINQTFPERKLYLFDTFEGFPEADLKYEAENRLLKNEVGKLANTSVEYVLEKMPYRENCVIRQGYFPDTAENLDEQFAFVNIDVDLYKPIVAGLEYFWPRMVDGGYLFVHDYFSLSYGGAKKAVDEFSQKYGVNFIPIGDTLSVAFVK